MAWHDYCVLRDDVRQGTLTLAEFAADLYAVRTGEAPNVYRLPDQFFDRTYPTDNLKQLVGDVLQRLTGTGGTPVIRVQVDYGGGKTHALISLLHLAEGRAALETHPTVREFMGFSGVDTLPQARVALLPFDKFDVIEGLVVRGPDGTEQQVKTPWGALAYQLAGEEGLAKVAEHEANYIAPAEPLLVELLQAPRAAGLSTLVLIDEALMYMRGVVNNNPKRLGTLQDFFQALTQAVAHDPSNCSALVASLITSDVLANDPTGDQVLGAMKNVFHRVDKTAEPVSRADISELLRRRLFESVADNEVRREIVDGLHLAMQKLPLRDSQTNADARERLLASYPFHPDLIEVLYQKWTQLGNFQRTRGVLRMFATALKASEGKDPSAFVGPSALLGVEGELSATIRELIDACEEETPWGPILEGELDKARVVQQALPRLKCREIEGAVLATFLHSQPAGQRAESTELYALLANPDIDPMSVEEGLSEWRRLSWFLKEDESIWALGTTPNLTNMHDRAMRSLTADRINADLVKRIRDAKLGQNADRVAVHALPDSPADIADNPELHFVVVGPEYAAVPGEAVSDSLKAFFDRTYRNSVIILAPDNSRLAGVRYQIRKILGWEAIESGDDMNLLTGTQQALLLQRKRDDETGVLDAVKSTYSVLIALDEDGEIETHRLPSGPESPFERVKASLEAEDRLLATALDPDLLTPDSYLGLWGANETAKPLRRLYEMFASVPRLPRLLGQGVFVDTLHRAVQDGRLVLRDVRPDGSQNTYWRKPPSLEEFANKGLEIVPIEHAELHKLDPELLSPGRLPMLWESDSGPITVGGIRRFFDGVDAPKLASDAVLFEAIQTIVQTGSLMAYRQDRAYCNEAIPDTVLTDELALLLPLEAVRGSDLTQHTLPEAWEEETSSVSRVMAVLAARKGTPIPWGTIVEVINDGLAKNLFEIAEGSLAWPCAPGDADKIGLRVSQVPVTIQPAELVGDDVMPAWVTGQSTLGLIKETLESKRSIAIPDDVFRAAVEQAINSGLFVTVDPLDDFYATRVRQPAWIGHAESHLTEAEIQDLPQAVVDLLTIAPELDFKFRLAITAEGERPSDEVLEQINEVFGGVAGGLKFEVSDEQ
jgi:hypothetical protein